MKNTKNTVLGYTLISEFTRDGVRYGLFEDNVFGNYDPCLVYNLDTGLKLFETVDNLQDALDVYFDE